MNRTNIWILILIEFTRLDSYFEGQNFIRSFVPIIGSNDEANSTWFCKTLNESMYEISFAVSLVYQVNTMLYIHNLTYVVNLSAF